MSSYGSSYHTTASPEIWKTTSYTIRRPGCAAWQSGIVVLTDARDECALANRICTPGHRVFAEQEYIGDLPALVGCVRTIEV